MNSKCVNRSVRRTVIVFQMPVKSGFLKKRMSFCSVLQSGNKGILALRHTDGKYRF